MRLRQAPFAFASVAGGRAAFALVVCLLVACGSPDRGRSAFAPSADRVDPSPTEMFTRVSFVPPAGAAWVAGLDADGDTLVVLGALRARVGVDDAVFGLQPFATEIALAVELEDGWAFVARDGTVARSDVFTGPLERLGDIGRRVPGPPRGPMSRGRLVALDEAGRAFGTDGRLPVSPMGAWPAPATALEAVFVDATRGAAILDGGRLVVTANGGESWRLLDTAPSAASALGVEGDEIVVRSSEGELRAIGRDGASRSSATAWIARGALDYPRVTWLRRLALWVFPELIERYGVATNDGGAAAVLEEDGVVSVRPGSGRTIDRVAVDPSTCTLEPWGARVLVSCDNRAAIWLDGSGRFRTETGSDPADLVALLATDPDAILSDDGRHAASASGCAEADDDTICLLNPSTRAWRPAALPREIESARLLAMHGAELLLAGSDVNRKPVLAVMNVERATWWRVELAPTATDAPTHSLNVAPVGIDADAGASHRGGRVELSEPRFAPDGTLYALARADESGTVSLALGPSTGPLLLRALPRGASHAALSDANHGVASGARSSSLWETTDGGRTWRVLSLPIDGRVDVEAHLDGSSEPGTRAGWSCRRDGCRLGRVTASRVRGARIRSPGLRTRTRPALATTATLSRSIDDGAGRARAERRDRVLPALVCGDPEPLGVVSLPSFGTATASATAELSASGARARIASWRESSERHVWQIAWSGVDDRGPFVRTSAASPIPFRFPDADQQDAEDTRARYTLRVVTRRGALVTRTTSEVTEHAWAPANGPVRVLLAGVPSTDDSELVSVDAAPDGGALLAWRAPTDTSAHVTRVLRLTPTGQTRVYRDVVTAGLELEGLAWLGSRPGFVAPHRAGDDAWVFFPLDARRSPELVPARVHETARVCGDEPGHLRVSVASALIESRRWSLSPVIELDDAGRPCIRALAGIRRGESGASLGLWAQSGALEGTADGASRSARLRCHLRAGVLLGGETD